MMRNVFMRRWLSFRLCTPICVQNPSKHFAVGPILCSFVGCHASAYTFECNGICEVKLSGKLVLDVEQKLNVFA